MPYCSGVKKAPNSHSQVVKRIDEPEAIVMIKLYELRIKQMATTALPSYIFSFLPGSSEIVAGI